MRIHLAAIALGIVASVACGSAEVEAPPADAPVVDAPPAPAAPLTTPEAPELSPAAAIAHAAILARAKSGIGHCAAGELALFDCTVKADKQVSLCAKPDFSYMQYRFGKVGSPDLVHPEDGSPTAFSHAYTSWARGAEDSVGFERDDHVYQLAFASGSGIDGELNNYQGIRVKKGDEEIAFIKCNPWMDDPLLAELKEVLKK